MPGNGDRTEGGWILLSAGITESPIFHGSPDLFRLWILLLCRARRSRRPFRMLGGTEVGRGELVTSLGELSAWLERDGNPQQYEPGTVKPSRPTVGRWLKVLEDEGMIVTSREGRRGGTKVTVVNFEHYQTFDSYRPKTDGVQPPADVGEPGGGRTVSGVGGLGQADNQGDSHADSRGQRQPTEDTPVLELTPPSSGQSRGQSSGRERYESVTPTTSGSPDRSKNTAPPAGDGSGRPLPINFNYETGLWSRRPTEDEIRRWQTAFPAVDLRREMEKAAMWLMDLPKNKRKKKHGPFLRNWFSRVQDRYDRR